jgi:hypothetical protein
MGSAIRTNGDLVGPASWLPEFMIIAPFTVRADRREWRAGRSRLSMKTRESRLLGHPGPIRSGGPSAASVGMCALGFSTAVIRDASQLLNHPLRKTPDSGKIPHRNRASTANSQCFLNETGLEHFLHSYDRGIRLDNSFGAA